MTTRMSLALATLIVTGLTLTTTMTTSAQAATACYKTAINLEGNYTLPNCEAASKVVKFNSELRISRRTDPCRRQ